MSALAEAQRAFADSLLREPPQSAGLALYRNAFEATHQRVLAAAFPVVRRLVGEAFFAEAALRYTLSMPTPEADLHRFGDRFAGFLATYPHAALLPWLADVARLEWAREQALHAVDAPPLDANALGDATRLQLHPSVAIVDSLYPVLAIWEANQPGHDGTVAEDAAAAPVLAWRDTGNTVQARALASDERAFVAAMANGAELIDALEAFDDPPAIQRAMARLAGDGVFASALRPPAVASESDSPRP
jgi:hypothetical protein